MCRPPRGKRKQRGEGEDARKEGVDTVRQKYRQKRDAGRRRSCAGRYTERGKD